jgi:hypothetical protein
LKPVGAHNVSISFAQFSLPYFHQAERVCAAASNSLAGILG